MFGTTLQRHILEALRAKKPMPAQLADLLAHMSFASKLLAREVRNAALVGGLGASGDKNVTGDAQKKLDVLAQQLIVDTFAGTGVVAAIVSEEAEKMERVPGGEQAEFILGIDPLDGSSNTDVNGPLGTIFGVYKRSSTSQTDMEKDFLAGAPLVAAGYVLYGPSTTFVYSQGQGVHGFTLDDVGNYVLTHPDIRCPEQGHYYGANLGNMYQWEQGYRNYVDHVQQKDPATRRPYSLRYSGALVGDVHRILIEGGVYFYPGDDSKKEGKLRLFYECLPLAFVVEHAGGSCSSGRQAMLATPRRSIHQRVPLIIGSRADVEQCTKFLGAGSLGTESIGAKERVAQA